MDWLKEIAGHLAEVARSDFEELEDIEVEIKWPDKFIEMKEYRPTCMSARELIEEAGLDWGIFLPRLSEDRLSVRVTLNQWQQGNPPTSFGALESRMAKRPGSSMAGCSSKRGEEPVLAKMLFVRGAIVEVAKGERGISGRIACPACGIGRVSYWVHPNGHIHCECSTSGCVHWIE
jgi:hypothetical protein